MLWEKSIIEGFKEIGQELRGMTAEQRLLFGERVDFFCGGAKRGWIEMLWVQLTGEA